MKIFNPILVFVMLLVSGSVAAQFASSNFTLISQTDPEFTYNANGEKYSACWGWYQASKNREYAIACSNTGTYWIDVTNPAMPSVCAYSAGKLSSCTWREAKSYQNYLYVISDDYGNNSFQIFDMSYLPDSVHKVYDGQNLFIRAHTLYVNQDKLYIAAATKGSAFSPMQVYSLANPASPTLLRRLEQDYPAINYVHDMLVRNDTVYASCGYQGLFIYKLTASNTFTLIGSLTTYPYSGYNHSSALTPNGHTLVFTDEVPSGLPIKIADVTNFNNIQVLATINQYTNTTPHNPFMVNNQYCFVSSYQDGLQLLDISTPSLPIIAGYFDTYPQAGGNNNSWPSNSQYNGQWGAYPFFPSGLVFALDEQNGGFLLRTNFYHAPLVNANFHVPSTVCVGNNIRLANTSSGANTFTWTFPAGATASSTLGEATISFVNPGTYTIALAAANASYNASVVHTVTVVSNNMNASVTSSNSSCNTCSTGIASVTISGGAAPYTYTWVPYGGHSVTAINLSPGCYTVNMTDINGCASTASTCVSFDMQVGIPVLSAASGPALYPNPANTQVLVSYQVIGPSKIQLKNILGELIFEKEFHGTANEIIDLRQVANGTYFISVIGNDFSTSKKLIVHR